MRRAGSLVLSVLGVVLNGRDRSRSVTERGDSWLSLTLARGQLLTWRSHRTDTSHATGWGRVIIQGTCVCRQERERETERERERERDSLQKDSYRKLQKVII